METHTVSRDALLDDARFWCLLYEPWLQPYVGDPFADGEEYYFSVGRDAVAGHFRELEEMAVQVKKEYASPSAGGKPYHQWLPTVSVLVTLTNGWRAGVDLMMCPGDFAFDYVVVPPSAEHLAVGVHGGNSWLPALRWEEVLALSGAARPTAAVSKARAVLLFYPACFPDPARQGEVKAVLRQAWDEVGFPVRHIEGWVDRTAEERWGRYLWRKDPAYGWICEDEHSLRCPKLLGKSHHAIANLFPAVAQLFASL